MHRATELVGKAILTGDTGEKVGRVADLLLSEGGDRIVAVVIQAGALASEKVLPFDDVQTLGRDAMVVRSREHVVGAREWRDQGLKAWRSSSLKDRRVVTKDGQEVGKIADVYVDGPTGAVEAYEVADAGFAGLVTRRRTLPRSGEVTVGPDVVLVSSEAAARLERDAAEDGEPGTRAHWTHDAS